MKKWKILKSEDVSPSRWFPILRHEIELEDGTVIDDYFISPLGDVVMILPVTTKGEIVLVKQYKHGLGEILVELPAGFQQKGKTLKESALAELEEETGIKTDEDNLEFLNKVAVSPTKLNNIVHCFIARNLEFNTKQKLDKTEDIEVLAIPAKEVLEMVINGEIWVTDSVANVLFALIKHPSIFE